MMIILYAGCFSLSPVISAQFTLLKCVLQPKIAKNLLKPFILGVQGHSSSSKPWHPWKVCRHAVLVNVFRVCLFFRL